MLGERDYMQRGYEKPFSVIMPLIILNVLVFLVCQFGNSGEELYNLCALHPYFIKKYQIWRLVTYTFLHGGFWHIVCNMWGVFLFGKPVERLLGYKRFLVLYFMSGVIGALVWLLFNWHSRIGCVGASGALFGVMTACAMAFPDARIMLLFPPIPMKMRTFVICYMVLEVLSSFNINSSIAHIAHLGGALGGFLYMRRIAPDNRFSQWLSGLFKRRPSPTRPSDSYAPPDMTPYVNDDDEILDSDALKQVLSKIAKEGYDNLSGDELALLKRATDAIKRKNQKH
ncbi:MAG: rhomboid family intramembrane serine protease [Victivallales bacterium]|nr:rhomboid family intramembrane serine protease [Victivallales bacterium]